MHTITTVLTSKIKLKAELTAVTQAKFYEKLLYLKYPH